MEVLGDSEFASEKQVEKKIIYQSPGIQVPELTDEVMIEIVVFEDTMIEPSIFLTVKTIEEEKIITLPLIPEQALVWARQLKRAAGHSLDSLNYIPPPERSK